MRLIIVAAAFAVAVIAAVAAFFVNRAVPAERIYAAAVAAEQQDAAAVQNDPAVMRAMACSLAPCVVVEAGGLRFLIGAGSGGGDYLWRNGYLRTGVDLVLLQDLDAETVEGLAAVRRLSWLDGRRTPLPVIGPAGVGALIDGVNMSQQTSDRSDQRRFPDAGLDPAAANLILARPVSMQQPETVFDTGVVAVQSIPLSSGIGQGRLMFRIDFGERSILVASCGVTDDQLARAALGADRTALVVPAVHSGLTELRNTATLGAGRTRYARIQTSLQQDCPSVEAARSAVGASRAVTALLAPLTPQPDSAAAVEIWRTAVENEGDGPIAIGEPGVWMVLEP